jgi:hypothetical protein
MLATVVYAAGAVLIAYEWMNGRITNTVAGLAAFGVLPLIVVARREGLRFRANIQWGPAKALTTLLPGAAALVVAAM